MFQNAFFLTGEIKWGVGEGNKKRKKKIKSRSYQIWMNICNLFLWMRCLYKGLNPVTLNMEETLSVSLDFTVPWKLRFMMPG